MMTLSHVNTTGACALLLLIGLPAASQPHSTIGKRRQPTPIRLGADRLRPTGWPLRHLPNPEGTLLATTERFRVCLWHLPAGTVAQDVPLPRAREVDPLLWSPDGRLLILREWQLDGEFYFSIFDSKAGDARVLAHIPAERKPNGPFIPDVDFLQWAFWFHAEKRDVLHLKRPTYTPSYQWLMEWIDHRLLTKVAGPMLATGHEDGTIRLWRNNPVREIRRIQAHKQAVEHLISSPDGRFLLSVAIPGGLGGATDVGERTARRDLCLWDVQTGQRTSSFSAPIGYLSDIKFSPDGRILAALRQSRRLWIWDTKAGGPYQSVRLPISQVTAFAFSRDGKAIALARLGKPVDCFDLAGQRLLHRLRTGDQYVDSLHWLPDNRSLLLGGRSIELWDAPSGKELAPGVGHRSQVDALQFSRDGHFLASRDITDAWRVWSLPDGESLPVFGGEQARQALRCQFETGERNILTLEPNGDIQRWSLPPSTSRRPRQVFTPGTLADWPARNRSSSEDVLTFSPEWTMAALCGSGGDMHILHLRTGRRVFLPFRNPHSATQWRFSPDETVLAIRTQEDQIIRLWDLRSHKQIAQFEGNEGWDTHLLFSPDSRFFCFPKGDSIQLYDLKQRRRQELGDHRGVQQLAFAPSGSALLTVDARSRLRLWDLRSRKVLRIGVTDGELWLAGQHPHDGESLLTSEVFSDSERRIRLFDPVTGIGVVPLADALRSFEDSKIAVSPDRRIIALGYYDVTLYDRYSGREVGRLPRTHRGNVTALAFSPPGALLAVGASDSSIYLWDWKEVCGLCGGQRTTLSDAQLIRCWHALASEDPRPAFAAIGMLRATPAQTLPFLFHRLHSVSESELQHVHRLVADLDSEDFQTREQASDHLRQGMRGEWVPLLHQQVGVKSSLEAANRLQQVLTKTNNFAFSPGMLRRVRAVHLLEEIGSKEASELLGRLAKGSPNAPLTTEAHYARQRMAKKVN